jgi:glucose/arabinose dehydrogenase
VKMASPYLMVEAFPARFARPLDLRTAPGDTDSLFVVEQDGAIQRLSRRDPNASPRAFLTGLPVRRQNNEEGLLGLAFHPGYAENRRLFLYFSTSSPVRNVVAEARATPDGERVDLSTLRPLLDLEKPYGNHNGGAMAFGPDGMLYVGVGDGGSGGDPHQHGQNLGSLLGKILRLDVDTPPDPGSSVSVPKDNPFLARPGARREIYAYGLRNPWRFAFDPKTGELWAGDVGQDRREEVDLIVAGGNYGWSRYEGSLPFERVDQPAHALGPTPAIPPLHEYDHKEGQSITGGVVYYGKALPLLGRYLFADFAAKRVWSLERVGKQVVVQALVHDGCPVSSMTALEDGEVLFACFDGTIRRLEPSP